MAYDEELAAMVRQILHDEPDLTEKSMFGGLAFLLGGNMAVAVGHDGGLMVRVDPGSHERMLAEPGAAETVMRGRVMRGWIDVDPEVRAEPDRLRVWVTRGRDYTRSLPPKQR